MAEPYPTPPVGGTPVPAVSGQSPEGPPDAGEATTPGSPSDARDRRGLALGGRSLRQHTARGTIINGVFLVALSSLGFFRGYIIALFLDARDYGVWGILIVGIGTLYWLKSVGISDKYVQQQEENEELAFQKAFTLEAMVTAAFGVLLVIAIPLIALAYGQPKIIAPGYVLLVGLPAIVLQTPIAVFFRRMDFMRQRRLQAYDPVISFVVMIALAAAGLGYWALLLGALAGQWATAIAAVRACPYKLRFRYDHGTLREYVGFSWPVLAGNLSGFIVVQASVLVVARSLGLGVTGYVALASTIAQYADRVDRILAETLYPAICAVQDRVELLFESFVKSNRLALMWGLPFGAGAALFAPDLVHYVLGHRWVGAIPLIVAFSLVAAVDQLGYNWDDYFRARGTTRPLAWWGAMGVLSTLVLLVPLTLRFGIDGYIAGLACNAVLNIATRTYFLSRLFPAFAMARHALKSVAPALPPVLLVLGMRAVEGGRSEALAGLELVLYALAVLVCAAIMERPLLREIVGYLSPDRVSKPLAT